MWHKDHREQGLVQRDELISALRFPSEELINALKSFRDVPRRPLTDEEAKRIAWHVQLTESLAGPFPTTTLTAKLTARA